MLQLRELRLEDEKQFIAVMNKSKEFYYPFIIHCLTPYYSTYPIFELCINGELK
ncbi:MAG: hypothetical protein LEGION0403_FIIPPAGN_00871 [Legionella sp.]